MPQHRANEKPPAVLIIGGDGSIGHVLAPKLTDLGYQVILGDKVFTGSKSGKTPEGYAAYPLDATSPASLRAFRKSIEKDGIALSHVVNAVGGLCETGLTDMFKTSAKEITRTIKLNLLSQIYPVRYLGRHLMQTPGTNKSFTLVSSINAFTGYSIPFYSAAKRGLSGFLSPAAMDLGQYGIRINSVVPGSVVTPETLRQPKNFADRAAAAALKRLCVPEEVADGIIACIQLTGMTGREIVIDAGQSINPAESLFDQARRGTVPSFKRLRKPTR